eukprot:COSAG02_NODE_9394_length_2231_cov_1.353189_1_plen_420_part_00
MNSRRQPARAWRIRLHALTSHLTAPNTATLKSARTGAGAATPRALPTDDPRQALADRYKFAEVPRFERNEWGTGLVQHLEEHGFAVAAGVLDAQEIANTYSLLFDHIEARSAALFPDRPVSRDDASTWGGKGLWGKGGDKDGYGLLVDQHCEAMWYMRGRPAVHELWTALHRGESDLAVSFDGAQLWRPWDVFPEWQAQDVTGFLHIDRRPFPAPGSSAFCRYDDTGVAHGAVGTHYIQGFISLIETNEAMGGNCICPGTHKRYDELVQQCMVLTGEDHDAVVNNSGWRPDYTRLLQHDRQLADNVLMCKLMPGDHMLWDDRCLHGNARGRGPSPVGAQLTRCSVFCSMSPMKLLDEETRECRRQMARLGLGAGHSSHHKLAPGALDAAKSTITGGPGDRATILELTLDEHQKALIPMK